MIRLWQDQFQRLRKYITPLLPVHYRSALLRQGEASKESDSVVMENLWQKAKILAEEAAKRSQALTLTTSPAKIADIVSETAKRSKDFALEASKKADELKTVADQHIKSLTDQIPSLSLTTNSTSSSDSTSDSELESFGITEDLKQFVKGLTTLTFQSFPIQDDRQGSDVATFSNVRQDLSEWQQKHATLVLTTVKEISRLRYELCPRHMKDRRFWRIYFTLVMWLCMYEKNYVDKIKLKEAENIKDGKHEQTPTVGSEGKGTSLKSRTSSSSVEQDLDTFLLGDLEDSDVEPAGTLDDDENFDDDFDKIDNLDVEDDT